MFAVVVLCTNCKFIALGHTPAMADELKVSEASAALSQSRSPRRQAVKITGVEQEMLQSVVRKHIIRRRWYGLLNIILLRLRQQKMGATIVARRVHCLTFLLQSGKGYEPKRRTESRASFRPSFDHGTLELYT